MVLAVTIASAQDFSSAPGNIDPSNGWVITSGTWIAGSYTETHAAATHTLKTGASGAFSYDVLFKAGNAANTLNIGLGTAGGNKNIVISGSSVSFEGTSLGTLPGDLEDANYWAKISSTDGKVWTVTVDEMSQDFNVNAVPNKAVLDITKGTSNEDDWGPVIYSVDFKSAETATPTPTITPTPTVTPTPTEEPEVTPTPTETPVTGGSGASYDPEVVRDFYANAYTKIYSPYDIITYNPDGTYTVTPGYPKADGTVTTVPVTYAVSGTVTAAADGKPIEGASVVLGDAFQKTDNFGQYRFDGISKGSSDLAVSADGFASQTKKVDVNDNLQLSFALDPASAGSSTVAGAANETGNMTTTNTTAPVTMPANNTTSPAPTQTKSPGFEAIVAALALIAVAGLLLYVNRKK